MPIVFKCQCGRPYDLEDENAGRTIRCLNCKKLITVPLFTPSQPPLRTVSSGIQTAPATTGANLGTEHHRDDEYETTAADEKGLRIPAIDPRSLKRETPPEGRFGSTNPSIGAGIVMMIVAVVWFFGALYWMDVLFYYPPILFVIGLVAFCRGILHGAD